MERVIERFDAVFTGINEPITLHIPRGSEEQALRVYRDQQQLTVYALVNFPGCDPPNDYQRTFMLILADQPVPASFKKYVATIPFGPGKIETHIVEI